MKILFLTLSKFSQFPTYKRAVGMGEADPVADNSTAEGRELNRRIMMKRVQ